MEHLPEHDRVHEIEKDGGEKLLSCSGLAVTVDNDNDEGPQATVLLSSPIGKEEQVGMMVSGGVRTRILSSRFIKRFGKH